MLLFTVFIGTIYLRSSELDMCFCGSLRVLLYIVYIGSLRVLARAKREMHRSRCSGVNGLPARDVGNKRRTNLTLRDPLASSLMQFFMCLV